VAPSDQSAASARRGPHRAAWPAARDPPRFTPTPGPGAGQAVGAVLQRRETSFRAPSVHDGDPVGVARHRGVKSDRRSAHPAAFRRGRSAERHARPRSRCAARTGCRRGSGHGSPCRNPPPPPWYGTHGQVPSGPFFEAGIGLQDRGSRGRALRVVRDAEQESRPAIRPGGGRRRSALASASGPAAHTWQGTRRA
jgi:hypothetical protein